MNIRYPQPNLLIDVILQDSKSFHYETAYPTVILRPQSKNLAPRGDVECHDQILRSAQYDSSDK